jgi:hypothetical protein
MALIKCDECGKDRSSAVKVCLHCGKSRVIFRLGLLR